ncbi:MAG: hypothetical protein KDD67_12660 [Ignavibacteriae bacterium]|nr:hypothetical protein [Ignavibacteriota bacterium]MCB9214326.1 hypothetical protein [Ignavibacteria bacterium]
MGWPLYIQRLLSNRHGEIIDDPIPPSEWLEYLKKHKDGIRLPSDWSIDTLTEDKIASNLEFVVLYNLVEGVNIGVGYSHGELQVLDTYYDEKDEDWEGEYKEDEENKKIQTAAQHLADEFNGVIIFGGCEVGYMSHPIFNLKIGDCI